MIKIVFITLICAPNICFAVTYDIMTLYQIHGDFETYNSYPLQRIGYDPNGRIWVVYHAYAAVTIDAKYSDNDGVTWNASFSGMGGNRNPSLAIKPSGYEVSIVGSDPASTTGPESNKFIDPNWLDNVEVIDDTDPDQCANDTPQILYTNSGDDVWCVWRHASAGVISGYDTLEIAEKDGNAWAGDGGSKKTLNYAPGSIAAVMGTNQSGDDIAYVAWRAYDGIGNQYFIKSAYYHDTSGWSDVKTIDTISDTYAFAVPYISWIDNKPVVTYWSTGKGTHPSYYQGVYSEGTDAYTDANFSWSAPELMTDTNIHNSFFVPFKNIDDQLSVIYVGKGIHEDHVDINNLAYMYNDGSSWSEPTVITDDSSGLNELSIAVDTNIVHILMRDANAQKYGGYVLKSTATPSLIQIIKNIL